MKATTRLLAAALFILLAASGPSLAAQAKAEPKLESEVERNRKRSDTLRYGIESEILELLKTLVAEKDDSHNGELLELLSSSRGPKLRSAVLGFFRERSWPGAEAEAVRIVEERDLVDAATLSSALFYLAEIRSKKALVLADALIKEDDKKLLPALIRLLGRSGGPEEEDLLLAWLAGDAPTEALRQEAIRALGEIGSEKAAERLMKMAEDPEEARFNRIYACEALAKIGLDKSVPSLVKAANAEDPNVRAAAVEALGSFRSEESDRALLEALRDAFAKARLSACKALGKRRLAAALPALIYKAGSDPDKGVKAEALRALAEIGGKGFDFLRERVEDKKTENAMRALAFGLLAAKDAKASMSLLQARLSAEAAEKERSFYTVLARELAGAAEAVDAAPLARILLADKDYLIRFGGLEWARKTKAPEIRADLQSLADKDPSEAVRKRAAEILASY